MMRLPVRVWAVVRLAPKSFSLGGLPVTGMSMFIFLTMIFSNWTSTIQSQSGSSNLLVNWYVQRIALFFAEINGEFYVLNGSPRCWSSGFEIYCPEISSCISSNKFLDLEHELQLHVGEPSYFVFGPRIYASGNGIYHYDLTDIREKLSTWDFVNDTWEESKGWGSHKTLPFTGSAAFTFHYDTQHPGNGYFFSFSAGKLSVNVIQDWNFKWSSVLLEVAPYCNGCFCSLDAGNFVLIASPSLDRQYEIPEPQVFDIYIITFNFRVNVDYCDDAESTPRFDYKFEELNKMQINPRTLPIAEKEVLLQLQAIGCFQM